MSPVPVVMLNAPALTLPVDCVMLPVVSADRVAVPAPRFKLPASCKLPPFRVVSVAAPAVMPLTVKLLFALNVNKPPAVELFNVVVLAPGAVPVINTVPAPAVLAVTVVAFVLAVMLPVPEEKLTVWALTSPPPTLVMLPAPPAVKVAVVPVTSAATSMPPAVAFKLILVPVTGVFTVSAPPVVN